MKLQKLILAVAMISLTLSANANHRRTLPLAFLTMDGIHADGSGMFYAADGFDGSRLYAITPEGTTTEFANGFSGPIDITNDSAGNLYVTNFNNATVSKVTPEGEVSEFASTLVGPAGITIDDEGNLYIAHFGGGNGDGTTILKVSPDGTSSVFSQGGLLSAPVGITFDDRGNLFTANLNNGIIIKIQPDGTQHQIAQIEAPNGFAVGHLAFANGRLFATALAEQVVYVIRPNGRMRVIRRTEEGNFPNGITFDAATNQILFTNTFAPTSGFKRIRLRNRHD
jgi:sugar lactone lactonase YvrE